MRHASLAVGLEQTATAKKHQELRLEILEAIKTGKYYPWHLLTSIQPSKFFSDLIESILGAVWVDSGSIYACHAILERLGVLAYMDRIIRDDVQALHPKELVGVYAVNKTVRYEINIVPMGDGKKELFCTLHIGDRAVARVGQGINREEVQIKAATEAVKILDAERESTIVS